MKIDEDVHDALQPPAVLNCGASDEELRRLHQLIMPDKEFSEFAESYRELAKKHPELTVRDALKVE